MHCVVHLDPEIRYDLYQWPGMPSASRSRLLTEGSRTLCSQPRTAFATPSYWHWYSAAVMRPRVATATATESRDALLLTLLAFELLSAQPCAPGFATSEYVYHPPPLASSAVRLHCPGARCGT